MNNTPYNSAYATYNEGDTNPSATKKRRGLDDPLPVVVVSVGEGREVSVAAVGGPDIVEVILSLYKIIKSPKQRQTESNPHRAKADSSSKITAPVCDVVVTQSGEGGGKQV